MKFLKSVSAFILALFFLVSLAACGDGSFTPTPASTLPATTLTSPVNSQAGEVASLPGGVSAGPTEKKTGITPAGTPGGVVTTTALTAKVNNPSLTPSVSGGISRIAFVQDNNLFLYDPASKNKKLIFPGGSQTISGNPAWSPDNKTIVFTLQSSGKINSRAELFTLNLETGERRGFLGDQPLNASDVEPSWAPDGSAVLFTRLFQTSNNFDPLKTRNEIWLADSNGQNPFKLASGQQPAWSPDSKRVVFVTEMKVGSNQKHSNSLHLINARGQNEWEPLNTLKIPTDWSKYNFPFGGETTSIQYPVFLEGGKSIGFSTRGGTSVVLTINSSSGGDLKLWNGQPEGGYGRLLAAPKGGELLLFEGYPPSGTRNLGIVDLTRPPAVDKPVLKQFGTPGKLEALFPAWSPDGTAVAFISGTFQDSGEQPKANGTLVIGKLSGEITELEKGTFTSLVWSR